MQGAILGASVNGAATLKSPPYGPMQALVAINLFRNPQDRDTISEGARRKLSRSVRVLHKLAKWPTGVHIH